MDQEKKIRILENYNREILDLRVKAKELRDIGSYHQDWVPEIPLAAASESAYRAMVVLSVLAMKAVNDERNKLSNR